MAVFGDFGDFIGAVAMGAVCWYIAEYQSLSTAIGLFAAVSLLALARIERRMGHLGRMMDRLNGLDD